MFDHLRLDFNVVNIALPVMCKKWGEFQICSLMSVSLCIYFSEATRMCAYWGMCSNLNEYGVCIVPIPVRSLHSAVVKTLNRVNQASRL